jgi:hypothetical protein
MCAPNSPWHVRCQSTIACRVAKEVSRKFGCKRAYKTFIPRRRQSGYIIIKPDFLEYIDEFGFLWFEDEYTVSVAST